ncbi:MAG: AI-2E family transporter [Lachnospiraceae bacterium]|nr:AI-2E family transporter [Lachnospiraceae bacterium]MBD5455861.1 AI-2E family transporter [Lachnospiraceae bacterium]
MKFDIDKKHISFGITSFLVIAASICFYYLIFHGDRFSAKLNALAVIASPILYGIVLAYLLTPIVNYLEKKLLISLFTRSSVMTVKKKKYMRAISVLMTLALVILFIYGFFSILIPNLITSIQNISSQFPYYVQNLTNFIEKYLEANPDIEKIVMQVIDTYSEDINNYLNNSIIPQMESLVKTVSLSLISVLKALWNLIIGLIISIYVLFSKETFAGQLKKIMYALFSKKHANSLIRDLRFTSDTFIGFISGKILDSLIIGILCFAGTSLLNMPYALLISVIVGVTNIIPFFGPYIGAIPSAVLVLMVNPVQCIYFIIFILVLQQLDGNVIGPKILGQSTGLTGFWVIFSITIFGGLFGILGMVIGVPVFAVIYAMVRRIIERILKRKGLPVATKEYINLDYIDNDTFIPRDTTVQKKFFNLSFIKRKAKDDSSEGEK